MQRGNNPILMFDERGEIFAFATGADATSEHEGGSEPMQKDLCNPNGIPKKLSMMEKMMRAVSKTPPAPTTDKELIAALREGKDVVFPPLHDRKAISKNPERLMFVSGTEEGQPVAVFGYCRHRERNVRIDNRELAFWRDTQECAGAWDERSFAIKVRGQALVDKLQRFAAKAQAGGAMFAGTFLKWSDKQLLGGVIVALRAGLSAEHLQAIAEAQTEWEVLLRLKAKSRVDELHRIYREHSATVRSAVLPGHLRPEWTDGPDSEVVYRLNPNRDSWGDSGPYSFEQLKDWILADEKYRLTPLPQKD